MLGRPQVAVVVRGPYGTARFDAIVDTGFSGTLAVPGNELRRLGLLRHSVRFSDYGPAQSVEVR